MDMLQQKTDECDQLREKVLNLEMIVNSDTEEKNLYEVRSIKNKIIYLYVKEYIYFFLLIYLVFRKN